MTEDSWYGLIRSSILRISPMDPAEKADIEQALQWVDQRANSESMHCVVYNLLSNATKDDFLLVHHRKSDLWLPCGGHMTPHESPAEAARRELREELGLEVTHGDEPAFLSISPGEENNTHVCLWFESSGEIPAPITVNYEELMGAAWFPCSKLSEIPTEPNLLRATYKVSRNFQNQSNT